MTGYQYTITNALGQSIVLNDMTTDPANFYGLQDYPSFDVEVKNSEVPKEGQHGVWDFQSYYGKRMITFNGVILGSTEANVELKRKLMNQVCGLTGVAVDDSSNVLTISWTDANGESWSIQGKLFQSVRYNRPMHFKQRLDFILSIKCADPVIRGTAEFNQAGVRGIAVTGVIVPMIVPFQLATTHLNTITINNTGSFAADTKIRLYGEATGITNPRITNLTTGQVFKANLVLLDATKWIEIDSRYGTVVDQDGVDRTGEIDSISTFILLNSGNNQLTYESDESDAGTGSLSAVFSVTYKYATI